MIVEVRDERLRLVSELVLIEHAMNEALIRFIRPDDVIRGAWPMLMFLKDSSRARPAGAEQ